MNEDQADVLASENLLLISKHLATKADLKSLESRLIIRLGGLSVVAFTLMTAVLGFLISIK